MADNAKDTLEKLADRLLDIFGPLRKVSSSLTKFQSSMRDLGWEFTDLAAPFKIMQKTVALVISLLEAAAGKGGGQELLTKAGALYGELEKTATSLAADITDAGQFLEEFPFSLFELLLVRHLPDAWPTGYAALEVLGLVGWEPVDRSKAPNRPDVLRARFYYEDIPDLLANPLSVGERIYGWGTPDLDFDLIAEHLTDLLQAVGVPAYVGRVPPDLGEGYWQAIDGADEIETMLRIPLALHEVGGEIVDEIGLALLELPDAVGNSAGLILQPLLPGDASISRLKVADKLYLDITAGTDITDAFGIILSPGFVDVKYPFKPSTTPPSFHFAAALSYEPTDVRVLLGHPQRSRLQVMSATLGMVVESRNSDWDLGFKLAIKGLAAVISAADLDGFFQTLLGNADLKIESPFEVAVSSRTGLSFQGGPGLEITAHPHLELGPATITQYQVRLRSTLGGKDPDLVLEGGLDLEAKLGPLMASVEGLGMDLVVAFKEGNAGPMDIQGGFKAPTGLGIVVDAGPVSGGGFLSFDDKNGRYSGVLQLRIYEIGVKAIGLLDTRLPGGEQGFSFLIIITAEFTPIQLGFGFTLNGVGGLAGIHRTVVTEEIQSGIRKGTIDRLLFPKDPVANAARLISDLRRIFPPAKDRYVFGPMAIIGWGTPTLIEAKVGILLELPDPVRLVLLGEVSACLPDKDNTLVELHISVLGILDFGRKLLSIDASLHDSRILAFTLYGDMALRLSWGTPPNFALSLGGLNPHFQPPPAFPKLRRLTLALCTGDNPRLSLQAYLAVTSNTVQFGARAELYVNVGVLDLNVYGFVGFDVLFNFSPFSFIADLGAMIAVRMGTTVLFGLRLEASLSGPTPWRVHGKAIFTFIVPIPVEFDETFGPAQRPKPLPPGEPWKELQAATAEKRNWSASSLPAGKRVVSLAERDGDAAAVLVDPMGQVTFKQKVLPFNRKITRFGHTKPEGAGRYDLSRVQVGDGPDGQRWATVQDYFAPAQFEAMSDAQKLSRPSFEKMDAGVTVGSEAVALGKLVTKELVYETIVVDAPWQKREPGPYAPQRDRQWAMTGLGAAARSQLKTAGNERFMPAAGATPAVALEDEQYIIVSTADFSRLQLEANLPTSKGSAFQTLADLIAAKPAERDDWQVVPVYEAEDKG